MAAPRRSRQKAARKCNRQLNSHTDSSWKMLQANIPLINEACKNEHAVHPQIGDDEIGEVTLASLPFPDDNVDFKTCVIFSNEQHAIYVGKSTNLKAELLDHHDHVKGKADKYDSEKDATKTHRGKDRKKQKKEVMAKGVKEKVCCYVVSVVFILV